MHPPTHTHTHTHTQNYYVHFTGVNHLGYLHLEDEVGYWKLIVKSMIDKGYTDFAKI